jgi:hypothetical protein
MKTLLLRVLVSGLCLGPIISVHAQDPRTPISSLPYKITAPGSYYLTTNLTATGSGAGITISADNVTLDLNGFAIIGGGSGSVSGINVPAAQKNILIRNGTVRGWTNGGINASNATNSVIQGIRLSNNSAPSALFYQISGLSVGSGSTVKDCFVANNPNCHGISVGNACIVSGCVARANSNAAGIRVMDSCSVVGNISDSNGTGITMGSGNRIDSNSCTSNFNAGVLIPSGATNNLLIRNSARANNPNYNIAPGNLYGRIVDLTAGGTGAVFGNSAASTVGLASTDPWANFAY